MVGKPGRWRDSSRRARTGWSARKGILPGPADEWETAGRLGLAAFNGFIRRRSQPDGPAGDRRRQQVERTAPGIHRQLLV